MACEMREGIQGRKPMGLLCGAVFDKCSRTCGGTMVWRRSDAVEEWSGQKPVVVI